MDKIEQVKHALANSNLDHGEWLELQKFVNMCVDNQQAQQDAWLRFEDYVDQNVNKLVD